MGISCGKADDNHHPEEASDSRCCWPELPTPASPASPLVTQPPIGSCGSSPDTRVLELVTSALR